MHALRCPAGWTTLVTVHSEHRMERFLRGRLELAKALADDIPLASYADVVLIITTVLNACASIRWPGKGIDRKRFIELLVIHSPSEFHTSWVSVPALIDQEHIAENETPYARGDAARIFRDEEIDLCIDEADRQYPNLGRPRLRKHCYASLIYEWLRCGYAHEYCPHQNATHVPATRAGARVSYIGRLVHNKVRRMVSFHLDYLMAIADYHVSILPSTGSPRPSTWWIDRG